jgi:hypothetical protein
MAPRMTSLSGHSAQTLRRHPEQSRARRTRHFLALAKTCAKLGVNFWNYLGARLNVLGAAIPPLPNLILVRAQLP